MSACADPARRRQGDELAALQAWTTDVEAWPAGSHRWGQYAERTADGRRDLPDRERVGLPPRVRGAGPRARWRPWRPAALGVERRRTSRTRSITSSPEGRVSAPSGPGRLPRSVEGDVDPRRHRRVLRRRRGVVWFASGVDRLLPTDGRGVVSPTSWRRCRGRRPSWHRATPCASTGSRPHYSEANTQLGAAARPGGQLRARGRGLRPGAVLLGPASSEMERATARDDAVPHQHPGRLRGGRGAQRPRRGRHRLLASLSRRRRELVVSCDTDGERRVSCWRR